MAHARPALAFECNGCGELHEVEDSARKCCAPAMLSAFRCDECGSLFKTERGALNCCSVQTVPTQATYEICEKCNKAFLSSMIYAGKKILCPECHTWP